MAAKKPEIKYIFRDDIKSSCPFLWVVGTEEARIIKTIVFEVTTGIPSQRYTFYSWDCMEGLFQVTLDEGELKYTPIQSNDDLTVLPRLYKWIDGAPPNSIIILKDFHNEIKSPMATRGLRNFNTRFPFVGKTVVILSPTVTIPMELDKETKVINFKPPTKEDLRLILKGIFESAKETMKASKNIEIAYPTQEEEEVLLNSAQGLTDFEASAAFAKSILKGEGTFDWKYIQSEKSEIVKRDGLVEIIETDEDLESIGGNEYLKEWVVRKAQNFSDASARAFGCLPPKGVLLIGPPGTGKTLSGKAFGLALRRPLVNGDLTKVFGGIVGDTEKNFDRFCRQVEAVSPCVLILDEYEKVVGGADGPHSHEVTKRLLGKLLQWMQANQGNIFIVATANYADQIPASTLRSGRFDKIYYVDFPGKVGRREIFNIHLKKLQKNFPIHKDPFAAITDELIEATDGFTGAEIEGLLKEALDEAFASPEKVLKTEHFLRMIPEITPVKKIMGEELKRSEEWALKHGAKLASKKDPLPAQETTKRKMSA